MKVDKIYGDRIRFSLKRGAQKRIKNESRKNTGRGGGGELADSINIWYRQWARSNQWGKKKKGSFPSFLQYVTILRFPFFDFTGANAARTFVSVLKMSSLSSSFGKPTYSVLSRRPGLNIAGSIISTIKKKQSCKKRWTEIVKPLN